MNRQSALQKIVIILIGLVSGILLFLAVFSLLLENVFFNSNFQKNALEKLGIYDSVAETAETLVSSLNESQNQFEPFIRGSVTSEMISSNIESIIDGMDSYFKGYTKHLPDLRLPAKNDIERSESTAASKESGINTAYGAVSAQAVANVDKINLQVFFMLFGERQSVNILLAISFLQFILKYIRIFALQSLLSILIILLSKTVDKKTLNTTNHFVSWFKSTVIFYFVLSVITVLALQIVPAANKPLLYLSDSLVPAYKVMLFNFFYYSINIITLQFALIGLAMLILIKALELLCKKTAKYGRLLIADSNVNLKNTNRIMFSAIFLIAYLSFGVFTQVEAASLNFTERDLVRGVTFIKGNYKVKITDAKAEQVCLLVVKLLDSKLNTPVKSMAVTIEKKGSPASEILNSVTDKDGYAIFMLEKGSFSLRLNFFSTKQYDITDLPVGSLPDLREPGSLTCDFKMETPGKSELTLFLERQDDGTLLLRNSSLQYLP